MSALGIEYAAIALPGVLRPWRRLDQLPYKVHTNRELVMPSFEVIPENIYVAYVEAGRFVMRDVNTPSTHPRTNSAVRSRSTPAYKFLWVHDRSLIEQSIHACARKERGVRCLPDERSTVLAVSRAGKRPGRPPLTQLRSMHGRPADSARSER